MLVTMVFDAKTMLIMMIQHAITMLIPMVFDAKTIGILMLLHGLIGLDKPYVHDFFYRARLDICSKKCYTNEPLGCTAPPRCARWRPPAN